MKEKKEKAICLCPSFFILEMKVFESSITKMKKQKNNY